MKVSENSETFFPFNSIIKFSNEFTRNVTEEEKDFLYKKIKEMK